jgi:mono/diheme cytochrome c family protein
VDASHQNPSNSRASRYVALGFAALGILAVLAFYSLKGPGAPTPEQIAADPLLAQGYAIYNERCLACHGQTGKGDGPTAPNLQGPPPGDLTDQTWKHGDSVEALGRVLAEGIPGTAMPAWKNLLEPQDLRAVAAYVYTLSGRPVPDALRPQ